jgi:hypothetical protein
MEASNATEKYAEENEATAHQGIQAAAPERHAD